MIKQVNTINTLTNSYFHCYYSQSLVNPFDLRFRQIKLITFENKWLVPHDSFHSTEKLSEYLTTLDSPPAHVYATLVRYLNPTRLTTKEQPAICLSGPFVVDFDTQGHPLYSRTELEALKEDVMDIADLLHDWYGVTDFCYVFSGARGFHLYVRDFTQKCLKAAYWGYKRERYETQQRHRISWQLKQVGIPFDYPISTDTRRIIRIPGTLHGATGLRCLRLASEQSFLKFELEDAQIPESRIFPKTAISVEVVRHLPPFEWEGQKYSSNRGEKLTVPLPLAILLILQHDVVVREKSDFAELLVTEKDNYLLQR